jgi:hypothetical protein
MFPASPQRGVQQGTAASGFDGARNSFRNKYKFLELGRGDAYN